MATLKVKPPANVNTLTGTNDVVYVVDAQGYAYIPDTQQTYFESKGWVVVTDVPSVPGYVEATLTPAQSARPDITGVVASTDDGQIATTDGIKQTIKPRLAQQSIRVATFGDSTGNLGTVITSPDNQSIETVTGTYPASGQQTTLSISFEKSLLTSVFPQAFIVGNFGISGQTTAQMVARDAASYSITRRAVTDLINQNPDIAIYRGGSINGILSATVSDWQSIADTEFESHKTVLQRLSMAGIPVIDEGVYGYSAVNANGAYIRLALIRLNENIKAYCAQYGYHYIDPQTVGLQSADGNFVSGVSADGVHLNGTGGGLIALAEKSILERIFGYSNNERYKGVNLLSNPLFANSSGGIPTGVAHSYAGCTVANPKIEVLDGQIWHTIEVTVTNSTHNFAFDLTTMCPSISAAASGAVYAAECDWFVEPLTAEPTLAAGTYFRYATTKASNGTLRNSQAQLHTAEPPVTSRRLVHYSPQPFALPEAGTNLSITDWRANIVTSLSSGSFKVGIANPRLVKTA